MGDLDGDLHDTARTEGVGVLEAGNGSNFPGIVEQRAPQNIVILCSALHNLWVLLELMVDKKIIIKYSVYYDDSNIVFDGKSLRRPAPAGAGAAWFVDAGFAESHAGGHLGGGY